MRLETLLRAAGDPTRLRILNLLTQGSVCVCDLQGVLKQPQPTVSRHLAVLRHAGLIADVRQGNRIFYSRIATGAHAQSLFEFLDRNAQGEERLQRDLELLRALWSKGSCSASETQLESMAP